MNEDVPECKNLKRSVPRLTVTAWVGESRQQQETGGRQIFRVYGLECRGVYALAHKLYSLLTVTIRARLGELDFHRALGAASSAKAEATSVVPALSPNPELSSF